MPGLVPGIHDLCKADFQDVDGRDKPGHDESATRYQPDADWASEGNGEPGTKRTLRGFDSPSEQLAAARGETRTHEVDVNLERKKQF